jgi:coenzyme F420-0:L-glutamate ligase/coenzyme F420-1:gamma-L-glutamate ligase
MSKQHGADRKPLKRVSYTGLPNIPLIEPGDDLAGIIIDALHEADLQLTNGDVLVIAQKVVSKAEGRYLELDSIKPSPRAIELAGHIRKDPRQIEAILSESSEVVRAGEGVLIVAHRLGFIMANAGIDESNIEQEGGSRRVLLLPRDPDAACAVIKSRLDMASGAAVGVIINDSFGRPWRNGVTGVALGAAGLPALQSLIGAPDLFGRAMRVTEIAVADELAAAASLVMGQSDEGLPVVHVRGFQSQAPHAPASALVRPKERDMFR